MGIIIPISKDTAKKRAQKTDNFRGITSSSTISTIFEHCLLFILKDYSCTNERQFGYKTKLGCIENIALLCNIFD